MIDICIQGPDRASIIQFMIDKGLLLKYSPEVKEDVPDEWVMSGVKTPSFSKEPSAEDIKEAIEVTKIDAHSRIKEQELFHFDSVVLNETGLRDKITRTLTVGDETKKIAAVVDNNSYVMLRLNLDDASKLDAISKGGTVNNKSKLAARGDLAIQAKEVSSRTFGNIKIFVMGNDEGQLPYVELNRAFL